MIRVTADWHYNKEPWDDLLKKPWGPLRRWVYSHLPDADQIGDTWAWKQVGRSAVQGLLKVYDSNAAAVLLNASGSTRNGGTWFTDPVGEPPAGFQATKILWSSWREPENWMQYLHRVKSEASNGVVLGNRQLGIRLRAAIRSSGTDVDDSVAASSGIDTNIVLSGMGFVEVELVTKVTRRQGSAWSFRAKREDTLELVQGFFDGGDGAQEVQAMLESRRRGQTCQEFNLGSERRVSYSAGASHHKYADEQGGDLWKDCFDWEHEGEDLQSDELGDMTDAPPGSCLVVSTADGAVANDEAETSSAGVKRPASEAMSKKAAVPRVRAPWRRTITPNQGGGNCLYYAIAEAEYASAGKNRSHRQLRA